MKVANVKRTKLTRVKAKRANVARNRFDAPCQIKFEYGIMTRQRFLTT